MAGIYVVDGSVVGTVQKGYRDWFANGCMNDWEDTPLGTFNSQESAQEAVDQWVEENE